MGSLRGTLSGFLRYNWLPKTHPFPMNRMSQGSFSTSSLSEKSVARERATYALTPKIRQRRNPWSQGPQNPG
jgi:hypothetical protein